MDLRRDARVIRFVDSARRFLQVLKDEGDHVTGWAATVAAALCDLYAASAELPEAEFGEEEGAEAGGDALARFRVDDTEWKSLFEAVGRRLEEQALYRMYFEPIIRPAGDGGPCVGSLADDLADIYRDIVPGLRAWDAGDDGLLVEALFSWEVTRSHWGDHALEAAYALHKLAAAN